MKQVKMVQAGVTVRLFLERSDAIGVANARTRLTEEQHEAYRVPKIGLKKGRLGWLVKNLVQKSYYDT